MALTASLENKRLATAGYVEVPSGPLCGNCEYATRGPQGGFCNHPKIQAHVDLVNGCCNLWSPDDEVKNKSKVWGND